MRNATLRFSAAFALLFGLCACAGTATAPKGTTDSLAGTRWQLDGIEYMDGTTATPDDGAKYTLEFDGAGMAVINADCNRLRGSYAYNAPSGLEFGTLLSTQAACPPESLYHLLVKDMPFVRSFVIKDARLHMALMADGGIYHFSPMPKGNQEAL